MTRRPSGYDESQRRRGPIVEREVLRTVKYVGPRVGSVPAPKEIVARRLQMDDGVGHPPEVDVQPHRDGPGAAEWLHPKPANTVPQITDAAILYLHGSGFSKGSPRSHRALVARIVAESGIAAFVPDYRLAPEYRFPAALEDAVEAYRYLVRKVGAKAIIVVGDSAGGGLSFAMLLAARDLGLPMPAGIITLSAWTDLAVTGRERLDVEDPLVTPAMLRSAAATYLDGADPDDPYASPLYGVLAGLPPMLLQVGGREILIEDSHRFFLAAVAAGITATFSVYDGESHVFQLKYPDDPQSGRAVAELVGFARRQLGAGERARIRSET